MSSLVIPGLISAPNLREARYSEHIMWVKKNQIVHRSSILLLSWVKLCMDYVAGMIETEA